MLALLIGWTHCIYSLIGRHAATRGLLDFSVKRLLTTPTQPLRCYPAMRRPSFATSWCMFCCLLWSVRSQLFLFFFFGSMQCWSTIRLSNLSGRVLACMSVQFSCAKIRSGISIASRKYDSWRFPISSRARWRAPLPVWVHARGLRALPIRISLRLISSIIYDSGK